ncbi:ABC transporter permease subunit [Clostridium sp. C8-1-8]|uniref:ABC transporter permease n=1 Tax=Clostridium sp. C8-1-8 TaxID=2698831 RepID=UPI00136BFCB3|nr:ABC transporter permease subunit [Clostridium sp. C8-1-8]
MITVNKAKKTTTKKNLSFKNKYKLFLMALPFLVLTFLFSYLPLHGWLYSFYDYRPGIPLAKSEFVGLRWFKSIFANPVQTKEVLRVMKNTIAISSINILTSVFPVIFAILLSEIKRERFKKGVQVLTTIPNFISWVMVYSVAFTLFSVDNGLINHVLMNLHIIKTPINFLASDNHTWLSMTLWSIWKGLGWGAIMYLAAITGIDQELYDAAKVDGCGRFKLIWNITVPGIMPTYFVLLLLSIANFINNGMDQYFVFQNAINKEHIEVLDLYVYNIGMTGANFSFSTAISMLKSLISVFLLFVANGMSKLFRGESII